ncbi:MAG: von Willebrand factor type A domain-containing protein [Crocinitomicaceae bacterium]|nr:von Willebrand factor type A domain-containing protein [Crocinitomicaceae bacterium]MBK8925382.1 von Willebrand factor type A domain-containing protein [Crocinitomicaceae bacterium]
MKTGTQKFLLLFILVFGIVFFKSNLALSQDKPGSIDGYAVDTKTGDTLTFVSLILRDAAGQATTQVSDVDGHFLFKNLLPGTYSLEARYVAYESITMKDIHVMPEMTEYITIKMKQAEVEVEMNLITTESEELHKEYKSSAPKRDLSYSYGSGTVLYDDFGGNTESYNAVNENGYKNVQANPLSTFSVDVDAASYSNVRRYLMSGTKPPVDAVRVEEFINYFDYDYPDPIDEHPFSITTEVGDCPWNPTNKLVHIGLQGERLNTKDLPANNLVFLLDVSGSMSAENKLPLLKKSFRMLIDELRPEDKVAIVVYAGAAGVVLESTSTTKENKIKILESLDALQSGGSTAGGQGIQLAYKVAESNFIEGGNNRVILATDGDFNVGMSSDGEMQRLIEDKRNSGIYLTCLGFGMGNYKDSKLEVLADKGNGNYAYIDNLLEAKKVLVTEIGGTLLTLAKDVKVQVEFNPMVVESYRLVGYENRLLNEEDFNDDKVDAGEIGAGHSVTALYEIVLKGQGSAPTVDPLRYQQPDHSQSALSNEMLTVKFRYKKPDGDNSILIVKNLDNKITAWSELSHDFKFSSAVAAFAMLLRNSDYRGVATYDDVLTWSKDGKGDDKNGYRSEFMRLVELTKEIQ